MPQKREFNYQLTTPKVERAKPRDKPYPLTDGGGLYVDVLPTGSKVWRYKYHRDGKREKVTIGPYPAIGIEKARSEHRRMCEQLRDGKSPAQAKQRAAAERKAAQARAVDFRTFAGRWVEETLFHRSAGYRAQTVRWLDQYVHPAIGDRQIGDIVPADVLAIVEKRRDTAVTADRIRVVMQKIFNHAIRKLLITSNPATPLRGVVQRPPVQNQRHLNEHELGAFWRALEKQGAHATTIAATKLLFLTMTHKNELLRARWTEFDLVLGVWDIPASRMKSRKPHRVVLSHQADEQLQMLKPLTGHGEYVFPSVFRGSVPMGDVTLNHFFKRIDFGVPEFSPHGTRGTAATLLREHGFARDVVEMLLTHGEESPTVAAYTQAEHAAERKRALQFLADRIDTLAAGAEVVALRA